MSYDYKGKKYSSKKHPMLEVIFSKYNNNNQENIVFYLSDVSEGYRKCGIPEPASISNTILDLCRQDRGIESRLPDSIASLGYDLRKKTGVDTNGKKFAGEFVFVGKGKVLDSWLKWDPDPEILTLDSSNIPTVVRKLIRPDEGGLFSVIDYCDVFRHVFKKDVYRVQNPMKWQPNEIDGFYASISQKVTTLYPVEAKALTTNDAINMDQLQGGYRTVRTKVKDLEEKITVKPVAAKMIKNGIDIAIFKNDEVPKKFERHVRIHFKPEIPSWR